MTCVVFTCTCAMDNGRRRPTYLRRLWRWPWTCHIVSSFLDLSSGHMHSIQVKK